MPYLTIKSKFFTLSLALWCRTPLTLRRVSHASCKRDNWSMRKLSSLYGVAILKRSRSDVDLSDEMRVCAILLKEIQL